MNAPAPSWEQRLASANTPDAALITPEAFSRFNDWFSSYTNATAADRALLADSGKEFAVERRAALKELIKQNADQAWEQFLSGAARAELPAEVQALLEKPVEGLGSWQPYSICNSDLPFSSYAEVAFGGDAADEQRYFGFPVGVLKDGGTVHSLKLTGYVIDDIGAFTGNPPRNLSAGDALPSATVVTADPITRREVVAADTAQTGRVPDGAVARFDGERVLFFESDDNLRQYVFAQAQQGLQPSDPPADEPPTSEAPGESTSGQRDSLPFSAKTKTVSLGYRTLIYIPVAFSDKTASPQSESSCYSMLREVNDAIIKDSHGRMQLLPTVTPLVILPNTEAYYTNAGTGKLMTDAQSAAVAMGYNWSHYSHRVVRYNGGPGDFGGLASVNADPGNVWMRYSSKQILIHELGHNFGLNHSHYWNGSRKSVNGPGSSVEYGHSFDPMGAAYENWPNYVFCSYQQQKIGWLKSSEWTAVNGGGRYRIGALDDRTFDQTLTTALRISRGDGRNYWGEYRRRFNNNDFNNGLLLQGTGWYANNRPDLFDTTYWSNDGKSDSTLPIGFTFRDIENSIYITPVARDTVSREWMDVQVNFGPFPSNQPPVVTVFTASTTNPATSSTVSFSVTAGDADGDELAYHWYFDDNEFHRNLNTNSTSFSWSSAGVYVVICRVTDMKGGEAVVKVPITVGSPSGQFSVSGRVTDHAGNPYVGVPVDNNLSQGASGFRMTFTDTNGNYTLSRLTSGTYDLYARTEGDGVNTGNIVVGANVSNANITGRALRILTSAASINENGGPATFTVERVGGVSGDFLAVPAVFSGVAKFGTDYSISPSLTSSNTFDLPAATASIVFTVTGINDATAEGPEDIIMALGPVDSLTQRGPTYAAMTINDDDTANPRVRLESTGGKLVENGAPATLRVTRFGATNSALAVPVTVSGTASYGTDYAFNTGVQSVTIPAGATSADLIVQPQNDATIEGRETITVTLGSGLFAKDTQNSVTLQLWDDDVPSITLATPDNSGSESGDPGLVRFTRSNTAGSALNVEYCVRGTALHGTDYAQLTGIAVIPANSNFVDVVVTGLADVIAEGTETAIVSAAESDSLYSLAGTPEGTVNIANVASAVVAAALTGDRDISTPRDQVQFNWTLANASWARLTGPGGLNLDAIASSQHTAQLWQLVSTNLAAPTNLTWRLTATNAAGGVTNIFTVFVQRDVGLTVSNLGSAFPTQDVVVASASVTGTGSSRFADRVSAAPDSFRGQSFHANADFLLSKVTLRLAGVSTLATDRLVKLEVWELDASAGYTNNQPAPAVELLAVATGQFPAGAAAGNYVSFNLLAPVQLLAGGDYAFVLRWNSDAANDVTLDRTGDTFAGGVLLDSGGRPMNAVTGEDLVFFIQSTTSSSLDSDNDGMTDSWELTWFGTLARDGSGDFDNDGLSDLNEFKNSTNPTLADSDGDGYGDAFEVANGFNPNGSNAIFRWTGTASGGDGFSLYQEANWSQFNGSGATLTINPNTPVSHDLYVTNNSIGGGGGFSASLDLGSKTLHFSSSSTFKGQSSAGVTGTSSGLFRIGGGTVSVKFIDTIGAETTGKPQIVFYPGTPLSGGTLMNVLPLSSPRITVQGTTITAVINGVLPNILIEGQPAINGENVQLTPVSSTNVLIMRADDTDGDGMNDPFEYQYGFDPVNPADGLLDLDNDGTPNWLESRLGTAPNNATQKLVFQFAGFTNDSKPRLQFSGGKQLTYRLLYKTDLKDSAWQTASELTTDNNPQPALLELQHPNPPPICFYRLEVTQANP